MLYSTVVRNLEGPALRKFLTDAEDWDALRALDRAAFNEGDLSSGGDPRG